MITYKWFHTIPACFTINYSRFPPPPTAPPPITSRGPLERFSFLRNRNSGFQLLTDMRQVLYGKHCGGTCTFTGQVFDIVLYCSSLFTALLHFTELCGHLILLLRSQLNISSSLLQGGWGDVESLSCCLIMVEQMDSLLSLEEFTVRVLWFIQKHVCVLLESDPCRSTVNNINIVTEVRESGLYLRGVVSLLWCFFFFSQHCLCWPWSERVNMKGCPLLARLEIALKFSHLWIILLSRIA